MIEVTSCIICDGPITDERTGLTAPFIAKRIWGREAFTVKLCRCAACDFLFFNPRFEPHEEHRLYDQYRGWRYQRDRFAHEPWYTAKLNSSLGAEKEPLERRRRALIGAISHRGALTTVLDFGGDKGQLIQTLPIPEKFVYEISKVEAVSSVTGLTNLAACRDREYDLIVCSHVLEHVGFPQNVLRQISDLSTKGTLLYLEVPLESPLSWDSLLKRICQAAIICVKQPRNASILLRREGLFVLTEHVNFFTHRALAALSENYGFRVIDSGAYRLAPRSFIPSQVTWCLGEFSAQAACI